MKKSDILASVIVAELDACLIILIAKNIGWNLPLINFSPLFLPVLAVLGVFVASWLGKKILTIFQLYKFVLTGSLNTFIDLGVLNLLIMLSGITAGLGFSSFKAISFIAATINSYAWNKYWTFRKGDKAKTKEEFLQFFVISAIGFVINVGTASLVVNLIGPQFGLSETLWANIGGIIASFTGLTWNFLGYKFIVFKK